LGRITPDRVRTLQCALGASQKETFSLRQAIQWVILDEDSRTKARSCRCGEGPYLCRNCAFTGGIISKDLALRLQDSDFALGFRTGAEQEIVKDFLVLQHHSFAVFQAG
jgi:hypothetical protein